MMLILHPLLTESSVTFLLKFDWHPLYKQCISNLFNFGAYHLQGPYLLP